MARPPATKVDFHHHFVPNVYVNGELGRFSPHAHLAVDIDTVPRM
jgi:hypothetical protein